MKQQVTWWRIQNNCHLKNEFREKTRERQSQPQQRIRKCKIIARGEEYNDWNEKFSRRNQQQIRWNRRKHKWPERKKSGNHLN